MGSEGGLRTNGIEKKSSKKTPLVSIVTVVYNNDRTIERAIESVIAQTYKNIEYIIIDGGSTDGTMEIVEKHADHIDYYRSEPDEGIYDAMNKGLALCNGDVIGILNSDDWYDTDAIATVAKTFKTEADAVQYGLCRIHDQQGPFTISAPLAERLPERMIAHATVFVPAHHYKELGLFDTAFTIAADYDLMLRLYTNKKPFHFHEKVLCNFEIGGTCHQNLARSRQEITTIRHRHGAISDAEKKKLLVRAKIRNGIDFVEQGLRKLRR